MKVILKKEKILLYSPECAHDQQNRMAELLRRNEYAVLCFTEADCGRTIADCMAGRAGERSDLTVPESMVLFAQLDNRRLNQALGLLRSERGLLKAVVTEVNRGWTWSQLYRELDAERTAFQAAEKDGQGDMNRGVEKE